MTIPMLTALGLDERSWATLEANGRSTRYLRAGRGATALLLTRATTVGDTAAAVMRAFAEGRRLLVPDGPPAPTPLAAWLSDFLDGMGATETIVLATGELCVPAVAWARTEPARVGALVLLTDGCPASLDDELARMARPADALLRLDMSESAAEASRQVRRFLSARPA